jgi:hypothetical protein
VGSIAKENRRNLMDFLVGPMAGLAANVVTVAGAVGSSLVLPALGTIIGMMGNFSSSAASIKKGE